VVEFENKIIKVGQKMKFVKTLNTEKEFLKDHEKINPNDFFRANFCGDPPNLNVTERVINRVVK
jgi:hypothetical protein